MDSTRKHIDNVTGVLLAGGKSRRMGTDKRFLKLRGETLLRRALSVYERLFSEIIVVVAEPIPELGDIGHPIVTDLIPNCATLGGLYTGLSVASYPRIFAAACDMPFLNPTVIDHLLQCCDDDVIMPKLASGLQPMHAVYSKACLPYFKRMMLMNNLSIQGVLESHELRIQLVPEEVLTTFDAQLLSFLNLNTPEDVELARILVEHGVRQGEDS
ncbi:molybdenum cofactor guanylyltransferase [Nitrospira sp. Nam74]